MTTPKFTQRPFPPTVTIHHRGRFIQWDTERRKPWIYTENPSDFHRTLSAEWGPYSWAYAAAGMRTAQEHGTSLGPTVRTDEVVAGNALGNDGAELSLDEIFARFTMHGLPADLPVQYSAITRTVTAEQRRQARRDNNELVLTEMERHRQRMAALGFPFGEGD